ncbi:HAD-IA family hydrolase [Leifsonia sp. H3M29-4]|uniref:HAD-IA family hydrolase n=1 Tax=Salinibacterium metalliresistens TaxID=3031321 RepID=UPI0023D9F2F6|nr:HAD-IA family hydrolase [Salinibacterium metalliresistens]MDF1479977.1 HAD-IA family hydrolase [Salinibacterium metalliresistens]
MSLLFIFDMDDVLYDYDWRARMAGMTRLTGLPLAELRRRWWHDEGEWAAEAGIFATPEDYIRALESALGVPVDEAEWVRVRGEAMTARPAALAAVRRASELGQVTLLTNNGALASKHLATLAPELIEVFGDHRFTSSDYGARKPDPVVFQRVLDSYGVTAGEAFFADDLPENVAGAQSLGITGYLYGTAEGLLAAIEAFAADR